MIHGPLAALLRKELLELLRDRRALAMTVLLPVVLYPLVFGVMNRLERQTEIRRQQQELVVAEATGSAFSSILQASDPWSRVETPAVAESLAARVKSGDADLGLWLKQPLAGRAAAQPGTLMAWLHRARPRGQEAERRLQAVTDSLIASKRMELSVAELPRLPELQRVDLAPPAASSASKVSPLILYLLLMTLFLAASTLSSDLVAGEKERGTLETLVLAPVPRSDIARSKLIIAAGGTALTGLLALGSLVLCLRMGWLQGTAVELGGVAVGGLALLMLPLALLLAAVMLGISSLSSSLREAQQYSLPALLIFLLPALLATRQSLELNPATALLPVANVAFAMRDLMAGQLAPIWGGAVILISGFWSWLATRWVGRRLASESALLGMDPDPLLSHTAAGRMRAASLGLALCVLGYFYGGSWLQSQYALKGAFASFWILLPLLTVGLILFARPREVALSEILGLRKASKGHLLAAFLLGPGLWMPLLLGWMPLQSRWLPAPVAGHAEIEALFSGLGFPLLFLLGALSPAIFEELLFRGAGFGLLYRVTSVRHALWISSLAFALMHLSVFRLAPTLFLGLLMGLLRARSGSIYPAMLMHLVYNGGLILGERWMREGGSLPFALDGLFAWTLTILFLLSGFLFLRPDKTS